MADAATRDQAYEILDNMLGYLGFFPEIEDDSAAPGVGFQILGSDMDLLIGKDGRTLDDLQYLLNRFLNIRHPDAGRVRLDVHHHRAQKEDEMLEHVRTTAETVRQTGQSATLHPMNSYQRRLVHNAFADDPDLDTTSPGGHDRLKRVTIKPSRR